MTDADRTVRLYELADDLIQLQAELMENGGVLTPEMEAQLDAAEGDFGAKVDRTLKLARQMKAEAKIRKAMKEQYTEEVKRLGALASTGENAAKRLEQYVADQLRRIGRTDLETPSFKVRIQRASRPAIRWLGTLGALPDRFRKVTVEADTQLAWEEVRAGRELPDGFDVSYTEFLSVR